MDKTDRAEIQAETAILLVNIAQMLADHYGEGPEFSRLSQPLVDELSETLGIALEISEGRLRRVSDG